MLFSILEVIEIQLSSMFEMGKGHILCSAKVISFIIEMVDLLHSINNCRCKEEIRWDGWVKTVERVREKVG